MNFDLIGILVLLRLIGLVMLITIVFVSNVFVGFGAFATYMLTGILFFVLGLQATRSDLKLDGVTGVFGPFVGLLGFAYIVGSILNADAMAKALGNGFTPIGRIFYGATLLLAVIIHFVSKKYYHKQSTGNDDNQDRDN
jgi:hypothetical protein